MADLPIRQPAILAGPEGQNGSCQIGSCQATPPRPIDCQPSRTFEIKPQKADRKPQKANRETEPRALRVEAAAG